MLIKVVYKMQKNTSILSQKNTDDRNYNELLSGGVQR